MAKRRDSNNRIQYIDYVEAIAILLVIICHFTETVGQSVTSNILIQFTTTIAVPLFFMANGTLLFTSSFDLRKHIKKTIWLCIALISWRALYLFTILAYHGFSLCGITYAEIFSYFCGIDIYKPFVPAAHFWFLYVLIIVYFLFPLLKVCYDNGKHSIICFIGAVVFAFAFITSEIEAVLKILDITSVDINTVKSIYPFSWGAGFVIYFIAGPYIHDYLYNKGHSLKKKAILGLCSAASFVIIVFQKYLQVGTLYGSWQRLDNDYTRVFTFLMVCFAFAFFASLNYNSIKLNKLMTFVSKRTMNIYAVHMILCYLYIKTVFPMFDTANVVVHILRSLIVLFVSIIITEPFTWVPGIRTIFQLKPVRKKR